MTDRTLPADPPQPSSAKWPAFAPPLLVVLLLAVLYGPGLVARARMLADPWVLAPDARSNLIGFIPASDPGAFAGDYSAGYFTAVSPIGYRWLLTGLAHFVDPARAGHVLSFVLLVPLLAGLWMAARRLAGYPGVFGVLALALSCPLYQERMAGGLQRAFSYPLMALALAALLAGRVWALAALTLLAMAFCPTAAVPLGFALAALTVLPAENRGEAADWKPRKRFLVVAAVGLASVLIYLPTYLATRPYGHGLRPAEVVSYPEIGPGGRFGPNDRAPFPGFWRTAFKYGQRSLLGYRSPWCPPLFAWGRRTMGGSAITRAGICLRLLLLLMLLGAGLLAYREPPVRRLLLLIPCAWLVYLLACVLSPALYRPHRYAAYPVPLLTMLLLPAAGGALCDAVTTRLRGGRRLPAAMPAGVLGISLCCLLLTGGRSAGDQGLIRVDQEASLHRFLRALPADATIAGWPREYGEPIDNVPLLDHRRALLTYESHQVFHQGYTEEMRRRTDALIQAYLAADRKPLIRLRGEFGVTHLLVDRRHFTEIPSYFEPFPEEIRQAADRGRAAGFEVPRLLDRTVVWHEGDRYVLDLRRL